MTAIDPGTPPDTSNTPAPETTTEGSPSPETQAEPQAPDMSSPGTTVSTILEAFNKERISPGGASTAQPSAQPALDQNGQPQRQSRSFEGLSDQETAIFKKMSNEAYNHLYPIYKEWKEQKESLPKLQEDLKKLQGTTYYDHENAFQLAPEYRSMTNTLGRLDQESEYWQTALANVEANQPWQDLTYDEKTGKYSLSEAAQPTPQARAYLLSKMTQCHSLRGQVNGELAQFQNTFKTSHQGYLSSMQASRAEALKGLTPAAMKSLETAAATKLEIFPLGVRNRPEVRIAAELMVINEGLLRVLAEKEAQITGKSIVARTSRTAGPANVGGGGPVGGNSVGSAMDAFHQAGFKH